MFFKLICQIALLVADLILTKWIPLKETIHYLNIYNGIISDNQFAQKDDHLE